MSSPASPDRCASADSSESEDDPLDGKPSEDAKLTHVDSCSSLPEAGDDLVPCARRIEVSNHSNHQLGRTDELGNDTLIQLLANASTLLTSQDLALAPNDPRVFLPTPFAPGQSARTLMEQEFRRKKQQEIKEWNALNSNLPSQGAVSSAHPSVAVQPQVMTQTQMLMQTSPIVMQQQLQLGRGQPASAAVAAAAHQELIQQHQQQRHLLTLQHQLSVGGLLNPQQINPMQRMYASNAPSLAFQQPHINDLYGVCVGLPQFNAFGGPANNAMMNNYLMSGLGMPNIASALHEIDTTGMGLAWMLQQQQGQPAQIPPVLTTHLENHQRTKTPKERAATKPVTKPEEKGCSDNPPRQINRWRQRYNELLEYKRIEGVSCLDCYLLSLSRLLSACLSNAH